MKQFIDKLIERLEKHVAYNEKMFEMFPNMGEVEKTIYNTQKNSYEETIRIVNQLAEEYNNDFCEWEKGSSGYVGYPAYYSKCCTTNSNGLEMQTHIISDWKFCPYCGKKIKIVPYQPKGE